ncbi:hypothetical protein [Halosimplex amylolyticum]|uniref:hypothetical protein n=1 Tax=Halosimplex amylolyticum TaxID=3396616 RepID=UPI003F546E00
MHPLVRVVGAVALLGAVVGLGVHYDATEGEHDPYPESETLATDYGAHVGEEAFVSGTVERVDAGADRATISVDSDEGDVRMTVEGFTERVQPGGVVQVHGTLEADRTIDAANVAVVNPAGGSKRYKYAVSAVGAVLVLVVFFGEWRVDTETLAFETRAKDGSETGGTAEVPTDG